MRRCAAEFKAHVVTRTTAAAAAAARKKPQLNILINNAAVMRTPERLVVPAAAAHGDGEEGLELQLATNHLSHFLLFELLKDSLLDSATAEFPSRMWSTRRRPGHKYSPLNLEDLQLKREGAYTSWGGHVSLSSFSLSFFLDIRDSVTS